MEREYMRAEPSMPGKPVSLWIDTTETQAYPALSGVVDTDVAVVGAGLTGVLTATLLRQAGRRVVLIDRGRIGCGATGHTTAKITAQHGLIYRQLLEHLGEHAAVVFAEAQMTGLNLIAQLVETYRLDCDFARVPFELYAPGPEDTEAVRAEAEVSRHIGLPASFRPPRQQPFATHGSLRVEAQAQYHPLRFLLGLVDTLRGDGFAVYEQTVARDIDDRAPCRVQCDSGEVRAAQVVVATHAPFYDKGAFFTRLYPHMAYAFAAGLPSRTGPEMFYSASLTGPAVRTYAAPGDPLLVLSGRHHKTGQGGDERDEYRTLEAECRAAYPSLDITHHWSTEDFQTPDGIPYIGRSPGSSRVFMASGFAGWGMTNAAASAILLRELVLGREHPWAEVFDPSRVKPTKSWRSFLSENANVAAKYVGGKVGGTVPGSVGDLAPGQGAVMKHEGDKVAAYRDEGGTLHMLDPTCTHLGCTVEFNEAEKTWDCPCHGSRYTYDGRPVDGPTVRRLRRAKVRES